MLFGSKIQTIHSHEIISKKIKNIIDVRETYEYEEGHIPYAKNIPLSTLQSYEGEQPVYIICQSGMRSKRATQQLVKQGVKAINIQGGMNAWIGPIKKGKG